MFEKIASDLGKYEGLRYLIDDINRYKNEIEDLYKYGMVLLGPDSFVQGEALNIINFFRQKGFELVTVKFRNLYKTQVENLFLPTSTCIKCGDLKWWMIQESAEQGVFCGVLFFCEEATEDCNCLKRLNAYKGKSNPLDNAEGVVRYNFAAINVCLNLIHIPDSYGDFFKDTSPFYKISEIVKITHLERNECMEGVYFFQIKLHENVNKYIFELLLYKVKYLIISNISNCNNIELNLLYYQKCYEIISNLQTREEKILYVKKNIEDELEMLLNIENFLLTKLRKEFNNNIIEFLVEDLNLIRILKVFTNPINYRFYNRDIFAEVKVHGININDFGKLILNTSLIQWK